MRIHPRAGFLVAATIGTALSIGPFACSSSAPLAGEGGACMVVTDCQEGLVCCNEPKGSFTCASVTCLQPTGAGGTSSSGGSTAPSGDDATQPTSGPDATMEEPETGVVAEAGGPEAAPPPPPPVDSGKPDDAGTHEAAASPPVDAGAPDVVTD